MDTGGTFCLGGTTGAGYALAKIVIARPTGDAGQMRSGLALVVGREVAGNSLEVLSGCGPRSPSLFKLSHRLDRWFQRETPLTIRDHLVAPTASFHDLADLQVELLDCRCQHSGGIANDGCFRSKHAGAAVKPLPGRRCAPLIAASRHGLASRPEELDE